MKKKLEFADFQFNFGDRVKDLINGITGAITAKVLFDTGIKRYRVETNTILGAVWSLENDLKILKTKTKKRK